MKRRQRHKHKRYLFWAGIAGLFFDLLWRIVTREPRWILADQSRNWTGDSPITGWNSTWGGGDAHE